MSESGSQSHPDDAMVDLLIKQVTEGLSPAEQRELDVLDSALVSEQLLGLEQAAAAVTLAGTTPVEPPAALRALLEQQAERYLAAGPVEPIAAAPGAPTAATAGPARSTPLQAVPTPAAPPQAAPSRPSRAASRGAMWGWLAAAACLVVAILGWMRPAQLTVPPVADVQVGLPPPIVTPPPAPPAPPTPAEERAALLANAQSVKVTLGPTKDPSAAGVTGDVVWDPVSQKGFLHFVGLASNDPQTRQYQIWVFDGSRDKRYPVDGGVFDVPADASEVVIPIHAALSISQAKAFAVTVEKPGGVVVSGLGHVVALGAVT